MCVLIFFSNIDKSCLSAYLRDETSMDWATTLIETQPALSSEIRSTFNVTGGEKNSWVNIEANEFFLIKFPFSDDVKISYSINIASIFYFQAFLEMIAFKVSFQNVIDSYK